MLVVSSFRGRTDVATPEGLTKDAIRRLLEGGKAAGAALVWWMPIPGPGTVGLPDFVICANGRFVGIEAKATKADGGRSPTALQKRCMADINKAGGRALLVQEEPSYVHLHAMLTTLTGLDWPLPPWRSDAVRTRRQPPPMR